MGQYQEHVDAILHQLRDKHVDAEVEQKHDFDSMDEKYRIRNREGALFIHVTHDFLTAREPMEAAEHVVNLQLQPPQGGVRRYRV